MDARTKSDLPDVPEAAVEAVARCEHAELEQYGHPGERHPCPPAIHARHEDSDCDGFWTEDDYPSWEDEDEHLREMHRKDARRVLRAALPVLVEQGWKPPEATE